jgi:predicted phosphodiesterase
MDEYHADPNRPKASEPEVPITESILAIGDTHFPFEHRPALEWAISQAEQLKPSIIVQCGDLYDMFAWSRFPKSLVYTPQQERDLARERAELFWKQMQAASPKAKCYQIIGNHDIRPFRQMLGSAPALEVFLNLTPFFEFPGVTTIHDERQELVLQGVHFIHGYKSQMGAHRDHMVANAVVGHTHLGGTSFRSIRGRILWELNAGFLGDPDSKAMSYTPQKITKYTLGLGLIDARGPRFIPYPSKD